MEEEFWFAVAGNDIWAVEQTASTLWSSHVTNLMIYGFRRQRGVWGAWGRQEGTLAD